MGFRFRKSFKLMPGVRINLSKSGTSLSLGGKGLTHNISSKGSRTTVSLPGTGLSYVASSKSKGNTGTTSAPLQSQTPTVSAVTHGSSSTGMRTVILIGCVAVSLWGIFNHYDNSSSNPSPAVTPAESVSFTDLVPDQPSTETLSVDKGTVEAALPVPDPVPEAYMPPELEVIRGGNESGFMLAETDAKVIPSMDAPTAHKIKSGAEVAVKGTTKDNFWLVVTETGSSEEYYVPASNVAKFSP